MIFLLILNRSSSSLDDEFFVNCRTMRYMVTKIAFGGSPTDEVHFIDDKLTYQGIKKNDKTTTGGVQMELYKYTLSTLHNESQQLP